MPPPVRKFDAAIVLGAMIRSDGSPSPALARRVNKAISLAQDGVVEYLLMTGGPVRHPMAEALVMRDLALAAGLAAIRIVVEAASVNTIGNAALSHPMIEQRQWTRLLLVTDAYHIPRSLYVFHRFGITVRPVAVWPQGWPGWEWWQAWLRELAALPWTMIRVELFKRGRRP